MKMKVAATLIAGAMTFSAYSVDYSWFDTDEHKQALDWPNELKSAYRNADPDMLMISVLNSINNDETPTGNDNFGRPIGVADEDGTIATITVRQRYHYCYPACDDPRKDENSTQGYYKRSVDNGLTWVDGYA
ncbi:MAG: hypothetical protein GF344_13685, partial [Chitinivibrionales bacterium]|nr:hypothetical protein [Chitinivibrionales bacterium]MBD3357780.1 hypothetical protein [Chitinivibrionales bacterium]